MLRFLFTLVGTVAVACLVFLLVSPAPPGVAPRPGQLAGAGSGVEAWLGAAAGAVGFIVTRASAAELCIAPSGHLSSCYSEYTSSSVGLGFETEPGVPPCHPGWSGVPPPPCSGPSVYSISASPMYPLQNIGPLPPDHRLFLWLYADCNYLDCGAGYGYHADLLTFQGDLQPTEYSPIVGAGGFLLSDPHKLQINVGGCIRCVSPSNPLLLGRITVAIPVGVDDGQQQSTTWGRVKAIYR